MASKFHDRWVVRGATFLLWVLVAASAAYWVLKLGRPSPVVAAPVTPAPVPVDPAAVARLLGYTPQEAPGAVVAASLASRFTLTGVVASRSRSGAALIAVDGRPPRPFRVGAALDDSIVLQSVEGRRAVLAASAGGPALLTLELPPLPQ
jgi:general secretion pathway protein C